MSWVWVISSDLGVNQLWVSTKMSISKKKTQQSAHGRGYVLFYEIYFFHQNS